MKKAFGFILVLTLMLSARAGSEQKLFLDYQGMFRYIANHEDIPEGNPDLFKFAAESVVDYVQGKGDEWILVVNSNFFDDQTHDNVLRGVQGNGSFYLFRQIPAGFQLLGTMVGNRYKVIGGGNVHLQFRAISHMSAVDSEEVVYEVDDSGLVKK